MFELALPMKKKVICTGVRQKSGPQLLLTTSPSSCLQNPRNLGSTVLVTTVFNRQRHYLISRCVVKDAIYSFCVNQSQALSRDGLKRSNMALRLRETIPLLCSYMYLALIPFRRRYASPTSLRSARRRPSAGSGWPRTSSASTSPRPSAAWRRQDRIIQRNTSARRRCFQLLLLVGGGKGCLLCFQAWAGCSTILLWRWEPTEFP